MATQLILTVGKNPLPVWVAWDRLTKLWQCQGQKEIAVQFVHTEETEDEKELLKDYCYKAKMNVLTDIKTAQHKPDKEDICKKIVAENQHVAENQQTELTNLHVHYTGGTQAMGVAAVCAMLLAKNTLLTEHKREVIIDASYLDPGRSSAPRIVSWDPHRVSLIEDTRVDVTADIQKIAKINGFKAGDFRSCDYPYNCPGPQEPTARQMQAGQVVLNYVQNFETSHSNKFTQDHKNLWNKTFRPPRPGSSKRYFDHPSRGNTFTSPLSSNDVWRTKILPALIEAYPDCPWDRATGTLTYPAATSRSTTSAQKKQLKDMDKFFNGVWLEYAAYAAFKKVLDEIKSKSNGKRNNVQLFHSVYVRTQGTGPAERHFELDVVAVLGYQVVVVSCSVTSNLSDIKQKAMEAYHRAKQLGGDEARAVVLCVASYEYAERVEKELEDETGTKRPLQVWGRQQGIRGRLGNIHNMDSLFEKFKDLLYRDSDDSGNPLHLHWQ